MDYKKKDDIVLPVEDVNNLRRVMHIIALDKDVSADEFYTLINWLDAVVRKSAIKPNVEGTYVNIDDVREDFMQSVYCTLDADPTNDRANAIIEAFDNLPTVKLG